MAEQNEPGPSYEAGADEIILDELRLEANEKLKNNNGIRSRSLQLIISIGIIMTLLVNGTEYILGSIPNEFILAAGILIVVTLISFFHSIICAIITQLNSKRHQITLKSLPDNVLCGRCSKFTTRKALIEYYKTKLYNEGVNKFGPDGLHYYSTISFVVGFIPLFIIGLYWVIANLIMPGF